jgi:hypothetical protein
MVDFKPSTHFAAKVMEDIHSYETAIARKRERMDGFLLSKPALSILSAGGVLFGLLNLIRMTLILIAPSACL